MLPLLGGLISGGIGAISSMFNTNQNNQNSLQMQQQAQDFNAAQAQQQMAFQKDMSSTAYQRASADMKSAGLNPMMMFGSGSAASSPGGAMATTQPAQKTSAAGAVGDSLKSIIPSAVALKTAEATIDNLVEQNAKIKAETLTEKERPALVNQQALKTADEASKTVAETQNVKANLPIIVDTATSAKNRSAMNPTLRRTVDQSGFVGEKAAQTIAPISNLVSSAKGVKSIFSDRFYY